MKKQLNQKKNFHRNTTENNFYFLIKTKRWTAIMREAVPSIHFIDDFKVATVEIRRVEFFEFNDQVVFRSKMDVRVADRLPINLKAVAGDIYNKLKEFGDPSYGNKVRRKLN